VYEGCGRAYLGAVEVANVVKRHRFSGKRSYLVYSAFDTHPPPALLRCVKRSLRTRQLACYDDAQSANPSVRTARRRSCPPCTRSAPASPA
jgi:hypothetical protein